MDREHKLRADEYGLVVWKPLSLDPCIGLFGRWDLAAFLQRSQREGEIRRGGGESLLAYLGEGSGPRRHNLFAIWLFV